MPTPTFRPGQTISPRDLLYDAFWKKTEKIVEIAVRQLGHQLTNLRNQPAEQAETAVVASFGGISSQIFSGARVMLLMSRHQPDWEETERRYLADLERRLRTAKKAALNLVAQRLPKRKARLAGQSLRPKLETLVQGKLREFQLISPDMAQLKFEPKKRQTAKSLNRELDILFLAANPRKDYKGDPKTALELDEEYRAIQQRIQLGRRRDFINLQAHWATRTQDLIDALNQHRPKIIHFSGHGTPTEGIVLVGSDGREEAVGAEFLVSILGTLADNICVVILNACHSAQQAAAISEVVGVTIGTESSITDDSAIAFSEAFYGALANDLGVEKAFQQAEIVLTRVHKENKPILLVRPGLDLNAIELIKVPDSVSYEPLGRSLTAASQTFLEKRARHLDSLAKLTNYLVSVASDPKRLLSPGESAQTFVTSMEGVVGIAELLEQEASDLCGDLDGVSRRWASHLVEEATSRLVQLEETAETHRKTLVRFTRSMAGIANGLSKRVERDLRTEQSAGVSSAELLSLNGVARQVSSYLGTSQSLFSIHYNQLLEFLPGDLLLRGKIKSLEFEA